MYRRRAADRNAGSGRWLLAGYAGVAGFLALEAAIRRRGAASSLDASDADRGTTRGISRAYLLSASLPIAGRIIPVASLPRAAQPLGLAVQVSGLGLRFWSMRTLGSYYSRTLRTQTDQAVVEAGPYALVRHPGYLGSSMIWVGFAMATRSLPVVAGVAGLIGRAYARRIAAEERLLKRELPGYAEYSRRTSKLIPFIW
jgi:protein-S-isoprenylcysteine O-methyltransferase Ste14